MTKKISRTDSDFFSKEEVDILRKHLADASDLDFQRFLIVCKRTGLDPFTRQIYGRLQNKKTKNPGGHRGGKGKEAEYTYSKELIIITSIDGLRAVAEMTGQYRGQTKPEWYYLNEGEGKEGWWDVAIIKRDQQGNPLTQIDAARVGIYREGFSEPVYGVANFASFAAFEKEYQSDEDFKAGKKPSWILGAFWKKMPEHQIAKCAEAQGIRKAFPQVASNVFIEEEIRDPEDEGVLPGSAAAAPLPSGMSYVPEHAGGVVHKTEAKAETPKLSDPAPEKPAQSCPPKPKVNSDDQSPFMDEPEPKKPDPAPAQKSAPSDDSWKSHKIEQITTTKYHGKLLSELSEKDITDLYNGWVVKYGEKLRSKKEKVSEAEKIIQAAVALQIINPSEAEMILKVLHSTPK